MTDYKQENNKAKLLDRAIAATIQDASAVGFSA